MNQDKEIKFVVQNYKPHHFSTKEGWRRLGITRSLRWTRIRIAAAVCSIIFLSATAAIIYHTYQSSDKTLIEKEAPTPISPALVVKVIDFEDTPLPIVLQRINEVYGVEVINLPDNADEYRLSLHYEGNALDLIMTINDILDTDLQVRLPEPIK